MHALLILISRGVAFGHLDVIISDAAYEMISPLTAWENPEFPGRAQPQLTVAEQLHKSVRKTSQGVSH
jgi:hypothetical protein